MAKDLKFRISLNIDGKEQLTATSTEVKKFRKHWDEAESSAQKFSRALMNFANTASLIEGVGNAVSDLSSKLNEFQRGSIMVQQQTGLMGEAMQDLRGEVQAVADTYGKDFTEVLTGVSRLMKGFGVDADEAMRLVRGGLVSGADAGGQFFDMLQEYPAYFKEAGVSAEQFVAILSNGGQMGVKLKELPATSAEVGASRHECCGSRREREHELYGISEDTRTIRTTRSSLTLFHWLRRSDWLQRN